jgi:hypothetical protein
MPYSNDVYSRGEADVFLFKPIKVSSTPRESRIFRFGLDTSLALESISRALEFLKSLPADRCTVTMTMLSFISSLALVHSPTSHLPLHHSKSWEHAQEELGSIEVTMSDSSPLSMSLPFGITVCCTFLVNFKSRACPMPNAHPTSTLFPPPSIITKGEYRSITRHVYRRSLQRHVRAPI